MAAWVSKRGILVFEGEGVEQVHGRGDDLREVLLDGMVEAVKPTHQLRVVVAVANGQEPGTLNCLNGLVHLPRLGKGEKVHEGHEGLARLHEVLLEVAEDHRLARVKGQDPLRLLLDLGAGPGDGFAQLSDNELDDLVVSAGQVEEVHRVLKPALLDARFRELRDELVHEFGNVRVRSADQPGVPVNEPGLAPLHARLGEKGRELASVQHDLLHVGAAQGLVSFSHADEKEVMERVLWVRAVKGPGVAVQHAIDVQ